MKAEMFNHSYWVSNTDPIQLKTEMQFILKTAGFQVLNLVEHYFSPYGYTALFLLGESHLALHTFPEEGKTYIELSSCVKHKHIKFLELI